MFERLAEIEARYEELTRLLSDPEVIADHRRVEEIARERAPLDGIIALFREYKQARAELDEARGLSHDADEAVREFGREEAARLEGETERIEHGATIMPSVRNEPDEIAAPRSSGECTTSASACTFWTVQSVS